MICGSDSGRIVILQYSKEKNCFNKVHQETFGKSGCRCALSTCITWSLAGGD